METQLLSDPPSRRPNQWIFWGVLLAPACFTYCCISGGQSDAAMFVTIAGSVVAGTVCGGLNARYQATHSGHRLILGLVSALFYMMMSLGMCAIGCSAAAG